MLCRSTSTRSPGCGTMGAAYTFRAVPGSDASDAKANDIGLQGLFAWPRRHKNTLSQHSTQIQIAASFASALPAWRSCVQAEPAKARIDSAGTCTDRGKHRRLWHWMCGCRQLTGDEIPASQEVHQGIRVNLLKQLRQHETGTLTEPSRQLELMPRAARAPPKFETRNTARILANRGETRCRGLSRSPAAEVVA